MMHNNRIDGLCCLRPEWSEQDAVLMAWPHSATDWCENLSAAQACFADIIVTILRFESVLLLCPEGEEMPAKLKPHIGARLRLIDIPYNDTWARDFGPLALASDDGQKVVLDYTFNGWGMKFAANEDNLICRRLSTLGLFSQDVAFVSNLDLVLEGGSVETNGQGALLTTEHCLCEGNRNAHLSIDEIQRRLANDLGAKDVFVIKNGHLVGDDTDGHIDTLARFCSTESIAYISISDETDEHYTALRKMEEEIKKLSTAAGHPYKTFALPMALPVYAADGHRLPATYANFLIINGAVLFPTYGTPRDAQAESVLRDCFPDREVIGIDCSALICQHGSLHCVTMQIPKGFVHPSFLSQA